MERLRGIAHGVQRTTQTKVLQPIQEVGKAILVSKMGQRLEEKLRIANRSTVAFLHQEETLERERLREGSIEPEHTIISEITQLWRRYPMKAIETAYNIIPGEKKALAEGAIKDLRTKQAEAPEEEDILNIFRQDLIVSRLGNGSNYRVFLLEVIDGEKKHKRHNVNGQKVRFIRSEENDARQKELIGKKVVLKVGNTFSFSQYMGDPGDANNFVRLRENLDTVKKRVSDVNRGKNNILSHFLPEPQDIKWVNLGDKHGSRAVIIQPLLNLLSKDEVKHFSGDRKLLRTEFWNIVRLAFDIVQKDQIRFDIGKLNLTLARFPSEEGEEIHFVLTDSEIRDLKSIKNNISPTKFQMWFIQWWYLATWAKRLYQPRIGTKPPLQTQQEKIAKMHRQDDISENGGLS